MKDEHLLSFILRSHPTAIVLSFFLAIVKGSVVPLTMMLTQNMIDRADSFDPLAYRYTALLGLILIVSAIRAHLEIYVNMQIQNRIELKLGSRILEQCTRIAYQNYEVSDTYNLLFRVLDQYKSVSLGIISLLTTIMNITVMFMGMYSYLVLVDWWVFPVLFLTLLPILALTVYTTMKENDTFRKYYPFLRKANYLSGLITGRASIKEARLFQYSRFVEEMWEQSLGRFHSEQVNANLKPRFLAGFCVCLQYAVTVLNLALLYPRMAEGAISIGVYIAIAQAMWSFIGGFQYEIIGALRNGVNYQKLSRDYHRFMSLPVVPERKASKKAGIPFAEIVLEDIWFRYHDEGPDILKGVYLTINSGQRVGIVGENGSGKSTLIKIVLGLLAPTKGRILLDGIEITDENRFLLTEISSAVFQDYVRYNLSLRESLALAYPDAAVHVELMRETIEKLHSGRNFLAAFRDDLDTRLGKERWDGQDLSGGQWQTISLARAIITERPLLILDEPTAALDPLAELDVYKQIYDSDEIQTALLITHRLGGIVGTDMIYLLAHGIVYERGTHAQLLAHHGTYAEMFEAQRKWYAAT